MTSELKRLIDDPKSPNAVRELLAQARNHKEPQYDFEAGMLRHQTLLASGAPLPKWADSALTGGLKGTFSLVRIGTIISVPIAGAAMVWGSWTLSEHLTSAEDAAQNRPEPVVFQELKQPVEPATGTEVVGLTQPKANTGTFASEAKDQKRSDEHESQSRSFKERRSRKNRVVSMASRGARKSRTILENKPSAVLQRSVPQEASKKEETVPHLRAEAQEEVVREELQPPEAPQDGTSPATSPSELHQETPSAATQMSTTPQPRSLVGNDVLKREMRLLVEARGLIDRNPSRSLLLVNTTKPKTGILNEEWDQVRLLSLMKLGRIQEVQVGVEQFHRRYPNSVFNERIRREIQKALNK